VLITMSFIVMGIGLFGLMHRRSSELARWERVPTGHRQGPDSLPRL
jgi:hypothetical protein